MIVYDLECRDGGHRFEGWFGSSGDFDSQRDRGLLSCPVCGSAEVGKAVMAPAVPRKGNQLPEPVRAEKAAKAPHAAGGPPIPPQMVEMFRAYVEAQAEALKSSKWVGEKFPDQARAMHYGEEDHAPIHGQATLEEAQELLDEGIAVAPVLFPVAPPDEMN